MGSPHRLVPPGPAYIHLPINPTDVAAITEELHHFLARPRHLCPPGFGLGVLLQPTNLAPLEYEIHLPQAALGSAPNRETFRPQFDRIGVLHEGLPWASHGKTLLGLVEREEILATSHFLGHMHHELAVILGSLAQMSAAFAQIPRILARTPPNVFVR